MKMPSIFLVCLVLLNVLLNTHFIQAEADSKKEEKKLPQTGRLAGTTNSIFGGLGFEGSWGGENISGENPAPIAGSVNRASITEWIANISNNTPDKYQVSLRIDQLDSKNKKIKSDSTTIVLKPLESIKRNVRAHAAATHAEVNLVKWKKFEKNLSRQEIEAQIAQKKEEIKQLEAELLLAP